MLRGAIEPDAQRSLRTLFESGSSVGLTDSDLLQRFLDDESSRSTTALESLVHRHAPMVRRVCASILPNDDAASDAFQATFLVLARRANSIRRAESVGPWLFGVARRVSLRSRRDEVRRRHVERDAAKARPMPGLDQPEPDGEPAATLFAELDRLPDRYRDPIVLCYLEGLSHEQAASRLGCRLTTFRTRLARGKDRLRDRLTRRGLAPAAYAGLLSPPAGPAASVPAGWITQAVALASAARGPIIAGTVAALARAGTPAPLLAPWKAGAATLVAALGIGAVALTSNPIPPPTPPKVAEPPSPPPVPAWVAPAADSPYDRLQTARTAALRCPSDQPMTIVSILPEGTRVVKDQLVAELDPAQLQDRLTLQRIATEKANARNAAAHRAVELAQLRLDEFTQGTYPQELRIAEADLALSKAELELARKIQSDAAARVPDTIEHARTCLEVARAESAVTLAESQLEISRSLKLPRRQRELEIALDDAGAAKLVAGFDFESEREEEVRITRMMNQAKIRASEDGVLMYSSPEIAEGCTVAPNQPILWCAPNPTPDPSKEEPKR